MSKNKSLIYLLSFITMFFLFGKNNVFAGEIIINEYPIAESITYGHPLFSSSLIGGSANVDGEFVWKESNKVLNVGTYEEIVLFISEENSIEIPVEIQITPRRVYLKFEEEFKKQYDEKDYINTPNYIVKGIIDSSVYVSGNATSKLTSPFIGEDIDVTVSGLELKGEKKENYYLDLTGIKASVHPKYLEKFTDNKNRITFSSDTYVPIDSTFQTAIISKEGYELKDHDIKSVYKLSVNNEEKFDISSKVKIQLKVNEEDMKYKRLKLYNYYNGEYKEIDYNYEGGILTYSCDGLGDLIISSKDYNYTWVYVVASVILCVLVSIVTIIGIKKYKRINRYRYKSLSRRKDHGDY